MVEVNSAMHLGQRGAWMLDHQCLVVILWMFPKDPQVPSAVIDELSVGLGFGVRSAS